MSGSVIIKHKGRFAEYVVGCSGSYQPALFWVMVGAAQEQAQELMGAASLFWSVTQFSCVVWAMVHQLTKEGPDLGFC